MRRRTRYDSDDESVEGDARARAAPLSAAPDAALALSHAGANAADDVAPLSSPLSGQLTMRMHGSTLGDAPNNSQPLVAPAAARPGPRYYGGAGAGAGDGGAVHPLTQGCRSVAMFKPIHAIDEGAYGKVWLAEERASGTRVALKQIKFDKIHPNEGFPVTALREINTLLGLTHPNIVRMREVVVGSTADKVYCVMEFLPHNLRDFLERLSSGSFFTQAECKCLLRQLLEGVAHMHAKWLLHRDLKTANILMDNAGRLVICDFGLARRFGTPLRPYTDTVVTLWYRAPEVLLGSRSYGPAIDVWSIGCIFAELLTKEPLFMVSTEAAALQAIFKLLGTPREESWPGWKTLPLVAGLGAATRNYQPQPLRKALKLGGAYSYMGSHISDVGLALLAGMLTLDPSARITAKEALNHAWFAEDPPPCDPRLMPSFPSNHDGAGGHRAGAAHHDHAGPSLAARTLSEE